MTDIAAIEARHYEAKGQTSGSPKGYCVCLKAWPCDARVLLDELAALRAIQRGMGTQMERLVHENAALRAVRDAATLVDDQRYYTPEGFGVPIGPMENLARALAAADKAGGEG